MKEAPARNSLPGFRFLLARSLDLPVMRSSRVGEIRPTIALASTDPTSGTLIFGNQSNAQTNGWTMGTDGLAATLYFISDVRFVHAQRQWSGQ